MTMNMRSASLGGPQRTGAELSPSVHLKGTGPLSAAGTSSPSLHQHLHRGMGWGGVPWTPERATPGCPMLGITDRLLIGSRHQASREWMNLPALLESLS
ncbi:unnamed protein product [Boreogadus saida]